MKFSDLAEAELPPELAEEVRCLLRLKMDSPEIKEIPIIDAINDFLNEQITAIKKVLSSITDEKNNNLPELNELFLSTVL